MGQSPFSEANIFSANQEDLYYLWNPKLHLPHFSAKHRNTRTVLCSDEVFWCKSEQHFHKYLSYIPFF